MADNVDITPGTGKTVATDDVAGVQFQRVKICVGPDGVATDVLQPDVFKPQNAVSISTIATVWTPASGKTIRLMGGCVSVSGAGSVLFEDNAASSAIAFRLPKLAADSPYNFDIPGGLLLSAANNVLKATLSGATLTGTLWGIEV